MSGGTAAASQLRRRTAATQGEGAASRAGGGATPRRPPSARPAASSWSAAYRECAFDRLLNFVGFLLHSATQVMSLLAWSTLPGSERFQRVLSCVVAGGMWLLPSLAPRFYLRWRKESLTVYRLVFFAFPLLRKARGIQRVLDADPEPGLRGILRDTFKVVWGSRLVAVITATMLNPLPLLPLVPHMLLQIYSCAMVRSNHSLCAAPLLRHPTTTARIHAFHTAMQLAAMALPGGVGQSMFPLLQRSRDVRVAECESFLTCVSFMAGLALPMLVLVKTEPPTSLRQWEEGGGGSGGSGHRWRLLRALAAVETAVEGAVRQLCGRSWLAAAAPEQDDVELLFLEEEEQQESGGSQPRRKLRLQGWERGFAWWLLIALVWSVSLVAATR